MRTVAGFLVAAAVGIHCSAPVDTTSTSAPELTGTVTPSAPPARANEPPAEAPFSPDTKAPNHIEETKIDFSTFMRDGDTARITSTTIDATTGATYATGTFRNDAVIGGTLIKSKGDKDVFLLKVAAGGAFQWVRSAGSAYAESEPRVSVEGAEVNVIGMTDGAMDCGTGPLATWSSATFFLCVFGATDGTSLSGGVFPTGTP